MSLREANVFITGINNIANDRAMSLPLRMWCSSAMGALNNIEPK